MTRYSDDSAGPSRSAERPGPALRIAASYSWRLLLVGGVAVVVAMLVARLWLVFVPVAVALFGTALMRAPVLALTARGWRAGAAAAAVLGSALVSVAVVLRLVVPPFVAQLEELGSGLRGGIDTVRDWLTDGPLGVSESRLDELVDETAERLQQNSDGVLTSLLSGVQVAGSILAAAALSVVLTFFFLKDGDRIVDWSLGLLDSGRQEAARELGGEVWATLVGYLRGVTVVALFDAVLIGLALVIVGVPAALPLAIFTFAGAYVPIVGAFVTGLAAVLVALVSLGTVEALIVLAAVVGVQQVESNLLQPVVMSRAIAVHPVTVLLAVTAGAVLGGVVGAFVAVPIAAIAARVVGFTRERRAAAEDPARGVRGRRRGAAPADGRAQLAAACAALDRLASRAGHEADQQPDATGDHQYHAYRVDANARDARGHREQQDRAGGDQEQ